MKPRTEFLLNSAGVILVSPVFGIMVAGLVVGILEAVMWTVGGVSGIIASILFDVDFTAINSRMAIIRKVEIWLIFGGGCFGGIIWAYLEISEKWRKHKTVGKGW